MQDIHYGGITPLRSLPKRIEAAHYNRVRLALRRLACPLRLEIPRQPVDMILDECRWVALHLGETPLLTWMDFQVKGRSALHEPVVCTLHLYHHHAGLIMGKVLDALIQELDRRLKQ
ncbi:MAG: hypothetical protein M1283_06040 [Gammaproteobacteria bacterium]|nr:hypothetical protein [Gammaproteobacteria bacterium]